MLIRTSCAEQHPGIEIRGCRLVLGPERRGKTTLAIHLATRLAERGGVLRVDADPREFAPGSRAQPQLPAGSPSWARRNLRCTATPARSARIATGLW